MYSYIIQNKNGYDAITTISMGQAKDLWSDKVGERIITISTAKGMNAGTVKTLISVSLHSEGCISHAYGFGIAPSDYSATIATVVRKRVTEKAVREAHESAMEFFPVWIKCAIDFYAAKESK